MLSKIFIFVCAIIGFIVLAIFGIGYFAVNSALDSNAKIFSTQILSQVTQDWDKDKLSNYLDHEYSVGWTSHFREEMLEIRKHKSTVADIEALFVEARDKLGKLKALLNTRCINFSNDISCFSSAEFEKGKAMLALGLSAVSGTGETMEYKVNMFVIESPVK